ELGGKSANILLDDAPLAQAVPATVMSLMANTGQTCAALTRLIVPRARQNEVIELARAAAATVVVGDPLDINTYMGPMVSTAQQKTVLDYIGKGIEEGARLVAGGLEPPRGLERGAFVQPTIFADVR